MRNFRIIFGLLVFGMLIVAVRKSLAEDRHIIEDRYIEMATVAWEPYYGPNLLNKGYISEITKEAFKRVGYVVDIRFMPWKRAMHDTKNGYFDGLLGLYYSDERAKWLNYSVQTASVKLVFFSIKNKNIHYKTLKDLKPYRIGTERGFVYTEAFDAADFLTKEPVKKIELNLNKLLAGRIDLIVASRNVFRHMVKTRFPQKMKLIEEVPPPLTVNRLYNGFPKNKPGSEKITGDFNKGFTMIQKDGTLEAILRKHGF
jgi:polar amino acid transport system substrate-binding protein